MILASPAHPTQTTHDQSDIQTMFCAQLYNSFVLLHTSVQYLCLVLSAYAALHTNSIKLFERMLSNDINVTIYSFHSLTSSPYYLPQAC